MGMVLRYSPLHQHINTNKEDEVLSGYNPDSPPHPGAGILRMVQETLEKCLQQPGLRLEVLHAGGGSHSRGAHRGVLLRHVVPGKTVKLYKAEQSFDNAGGSKVTVKGYSVATSAASAQVVAKVLATDGIIYAIDSVV